MEEKTVEAVKKYRVFEVLKYGELSEEEIKTIKSAYKFAYILHDKDTDENGEIKKPHWHIIVEYKNARGLTSIAKALNVEMNLVKIVKSKRAMLRYLLHVDNDEKYQYEFDKIKQSGYNDSIWNKRTLSEEEAVLKVIEIIEQKEIKTTKQLIRECAKNGCWAELRRGSTLFLQCFKEEKELNNATNL